MKVSNLGEGQVLKNYKALCAELEIVYKGGKGKIYQLLDLERYLRYSKKGRSFIIEEIYDKPKPKLKNGSDYIRLVELLILDLLARNKEKRIVKSNNQLLRTMNMANSNYSECGRMIPKFAQHINVNRAIVYDFYSSSDSSFRGTIKRALKSLEDRRCIFFKKAIMIKRLDDYQHELANTDEEEFIISFEREVLDEMNAESIGKKIQKVSDVVGTNKWYEFKRRVKEKIYSDNAYEIDFYYYVYDITLNRKGILASYNSILDLLLNDVEIQKDKLNETIINKFLHNANERRKKALKENEAVWGTLEIDNCRIEDSYIEDTEKLLHILIKAGSTNIIHKVKKVKLEPALPNEITNKIADELDSLFT
ncbi:hypothetical protein [Halalkalibacter okhensis]|uniref:Uncharacterized protein n=1 Tax=Halalkalibacter okhensis TaxID=333138 RepID=A0A0B0IDQ0_9BACI|nr:hypothetical protein [Halalkalibacter okhensis]KHF40723.1 hypothetical protein LQ50_08020 [Halalkalibacter okhensis]